MVKGNLEESNEILMSRGLSSLKLIQKHMMIEIIKK